MYKKIICTALLCVLIGLSGCSKAEEVSKLPEASTMETIIEEISIEDNLNKEETEETFVETEADGEGILEEEKELKHESMQASTILEDENAVYLCGRQHILKWNKNDQTTDIIWMTDKEKIEETTYAYRYSNGILLEDKIYFIESWLKDPANPLASENLYALSVVNTDGSCYQEIEQISNTNHLLLLDGILYFDYDVNSGALEGYVTDPMGNLMIESGKVTTEPANVPEECTVLSYYNNGVRQLTAVESAYRFGYYLLFDEDYKVCKVDQNTGSKEKLPEEITSDSLVSWNTTSFLFRDYTENILYLVDNYTWETNLLLNQASDVSVIGMNEEYVYWMRYNTGDDYRQYIFERIQIQTCTVEELFAIDAFVGMPDASPEYLMNISVLNDYLYYVGAQDYKYYPMRRNVSMPGAEEVIGEAFFDSGISEIGTITSYKEVIYSENYPDSRLGEIDLEWLVVDSKFAGAAKINAVLEEKQQENISYERDAAKEMEEWAPDGPQSSLSSRVSPIYYFNELFISFTQQEYDYAGGAHGMPYWIPYTFNLETGDQLGLQDIVANSEEELKEIVKAEFTEMYNVEPGMYWNDAIDIVYESTTFESNFYLSEEGLVIYYGPYDLASYAAGFQEIVVPYDKLNLYIPLGE